MDKTTFTLTPFISMSGKAAEAIEFYKKHLGARVVFLKTYEDMKEYDPNFKYEENKARYISHSVLLIGENQLFVSDEIMNGDTTLNLGNSMSLCIESASLESISGIYDSLTADKQVKVLVPLAKNIFSPGYGIIEDPFGVLIQLNTSSR